MGENINTKEYWDKKLTRVITYHKGPWRVRVYKFLLDILPKNKKFSLLDVGCGLGDGLGMLHKYFPLAKLYGLDFSNAGIKEAKKRYPEIDFICTDIYSYEFQQKYSYITIIRTLEHLSYPFEILDKCLKSATRAVLLNNPSPKLKCREHINKFYPDSFNNYLIKNLTKKPSTDHGTVLAVYSRKNQK